MLKKQTGFSIIGLIAVLAILSLAGFVGYFVWDKNKTKEAGVATNSVQTAGVAATPTAKASPTSTPLPTPTPVKVPDGYVLYENTNPKFSFVYPKEWDSHKESGWAKGVNIAVEDVDKDLKQYSIVQDATYRYDTSSKQWIYKPDYGYKPIVLWKDNSKMVYDMTVGEGGLYIPRAAFVMNNKIYFLTAPNMNGCENPNQCYDDGKHVVIKYSDALEQIAKSITF